VLQGPRPSIYVAQENLEAVVSMRTVGNVDITEWTAMGSENNIRTALGYGNGLVRHSMHFNDGWQDAMFERLFALAEGRRLLVEHPLVAQSFQGYADAPTKSKCQKFMKDVEQHYREIDQQTPRDPGCKLAQHRDPVYKELLTDEFYEMKLGNCHGLASQTDPNHPMGWSANFNASLHGVECLEVVTKDALLNFNIAYCPENVGSEDEFLKKYSTHQINQQCEDVYGVAPRVEMHNAASSEGLGDGVSMGVHPSSLDPEYESIMEGLDGGWSAMRREMQEESLTFRLRYRDEEWDVVGGRGHCELDVGRFAPTELLRYQYPRTVEMAAQTMTAAQAEAAVQREEAVAERVEELWHAVQAWWGRIGEHVDGGGVGFGGGDGGGGGGGGGEGGRDEGGNKGVREGHLRGATPEDASDASLRGATPEDDLLVLLRHARSQSEAETIEAAVALARAARAARAAAANGGDLEGIGAGGDGSDSRSPLQGAMHPWQASTLHHLSS
jgi:hypothetical protein